MSIRLAARRTPKGRDAASIRNWALAFLAIGIVGQGLIQNQLLRLDQVTVEQLAAAMEQKPLVQSLASVAVVCDIVAPCAAPLLCFLLVEGFRNTSCFEKYLLRVGVLAIITEIPYNLAMGGKLLDLDSRNPVFGMVICLIMLFLFSRYGEKGLKNLLIKAVIAVAAFLWCRMLSIDQGVCLVILVGFLWLVRDKSNVRAMFAFSGAMVCTMFSLYYLGACLSSIMLHRYNGERGEQNETLNYAFYPALLLIVGIVGLFL